MPGEETLKGAEDSLQEHRDFREKSGQGELLRNWGGATGNRSGEAIEGECLQVQQMLPMGKQGED